MWFPTHPSNRKHEDTKITKNTRRILMSVSWLIETRLPTLW